MPTSPVTSSDDPPSDDCITPANDLIIKLPTSITSPGTVKTAADGETTCTQVTLVKERASPASPSNDSSKQVNTSPVFLSNSNSSSSSSSSLSSSPSPPPPRQVQPPPASTTEPLPPQPPPATVSSSSTSSTSSSYLTTNSLAQPPSPVTITTSSSSNHPTSTSSICLSSQANTSDMTHITNISDDDLTDQQDKDFVNNINDIKKQVETAAPSSPTASPVAAVLLSSNSLAPESTVSQGIGSSPAAVAGGFTFSDFLSASNNKIKQIQQLQRFLSTLQSFACDLSPEIGHAVRSLIIALAVSSATSSHPSAVHCLSVSTRVAIDTLGDS